MSSGASGQTSIRLDDHLFEHDLEKELLERPQSWKYKNNEWFFNDLEDLQTRSILNPIISELRINEK